ncbi:uncharacterized protein STEHIDRAFT_153251 [Stereum hirsutum FP-91666 SS1]|uniref:uncharacterized protein n=1 Tax=Stereum hirsutum (strain FP-91666) TaxID=721885 RepID=UPI000440BB47|nr:uncharacterized protein STEHIDRAFT_153251 [Stereum hirsutum FP-91666 SS1]EIM91625.1 hypothetical protein STEHIDRAFT_153251 [Stereum hirsutum FP-91666 SS1]
MIFSAATFVSVLAAAATLVSGASVKRQGVDNGSCAQLENICSNNVASTLQNIWAVESCLFAGVCFERNGTTLDDFLRVMWERKGNSGNPPASINIPRVPQGTFNAISGGPVGGGGSITQQNYIDGYYHTLDATNGPYPTSSSIVISDFHRIASWANFCTGGIPYQNFADYFQYSASRPANFCPT